MSLSASLVITTKNRKEELRAALLSALKQSVPLEIIVIDDGSTDGTAPMIAAEFPRVRLIRREESRGLIVRRNEGAHLATGEIIFSIDDDAVFSTPRVVEQTLGDFNDPRIGAVAIPYLEPNKENRVLQKAPNNDGIWIASHYIGTAHALRRELFLRLGGYREYLIHQGEESDYSIRMLNAGYYVRLGNSDPIFHYESPKRDFQRMDYYGARNSILFVWNNIPLPYLTTHLAVTTVKGLIWTFEPKRLKIRARALWDAWKLIPQMSREPVRVTTYRQFRKSRGKDGIISPSTVIAEGNGDKIQQARKTVG